MLARFDVGGVPHWLLHRHRKWCDWSLVGGHVEPDERSDWMLTAMRESNEELDPLACGIDFAIDPLALPISAWGPVESRSAGGAMTTYRVRWFCARFLRDPTDCLQQLAREDFALVPEPALSTTPGVASVVLRLLHEAREQAVALPFAGTLPSAILPHASATIVDP